jgi:hypothetical protein
LDDPVPACSRPWIDAENLHEERLGGRRTFLYDGDGLQNLLGDVEVRETLWTSSLSSSASIRRISFFADASSATSTVVFGTS